MKLLAKKYCLSPTIKLVRKILNYALGPRASKFPRKITLDWRDYLDSNFYGIFLNSHLENPDPTNLRRPLHKAFRRRGLRPRIFPKWWWRDFGLILAQYVDDSSKLVSEIDNKLSLLAHRSNQSQNFSSLLLHQYKIALLFGKFSAAFAIRETYSRTAMSQISKGSITDQQMTLSAIGAHLEHDPEGAFQLQITRNAISGDLLSRLELFTALCRGPLIGPVNDLHSEILLKNRTFHEYVRGRTVAIVGPVSSGRPDGELIDSYDIVVRMNFRPETTKLLAVEKGSKTSISVFNSVHLPLLEKTSVPKAGSLEWMVFPSWIPTKDVHKANWDHIPSKGIRNLEDFHMFLLNGYMNAIPGFLFDLLVFMPAKVTIFHADLMLTKGRDPGYNPAELNLASEISQIREFRQESCRSHDPLSQFILLSNIARSESVHYDSTLTEILGLSPLEYMKKLDKIYGQLR